jgi:hypothetical protein
MSDKGKTAAIEELRREVGYGCPVCRSPFLTWHHFDPPAHVEQHWRPEGIIAMCPLCHTDADEKGKNAGAYSIAELRAMKRSKHSSEDVRGHFPSWQDKEKLLVRVGGCYADTSAPIISVNEIPQIRIEKNKAGLLSLSFELRNKNDKVLVRMEDNWFTAYPANIHDMIVTPKTKEVKVWLNKEDVGLEFSFKRITMADLEEVLTQDWNKQKKRAEEQKQAMLSRLPPEGRELMQRVMQEDRPRPRQLPPGAEMLPEAIREAYLADDPTGVFVKRWVRDNCLMDDGLIPFLNFDQMAIYFHGERISLKDGIAASIFYSAAFNSGKGAVNLRCPCRQCSPEAHC